MHHNGLLTPTEYLYGSVARFDGVDPDFFSMLELNKMVTMLEIEWEYCQLLWTVSGKEITEGLTPLEGEADIMTLIRGLSTDVFVVNVYMKRLTLFEARLRMAQIREDLLNSAFPYDMPSDKNVI